MHSPLLVTTLFIAFLTLSLLSLLFATFSILKTLRKPKPRQDTLDPAELKSSLSEILDKTQIHTRENDPTHVAGSLLLEIMPPAGDGDGDGDAGSGGEKKKKRRRGKKKTKPEERDDSGLDSGSGTALKPELVCLYPFTSTSSATQRKIKQQYDQLVKCNEAKGLTLAQVGDFANCLIEARNELQHKSEVIKRKFTITKALLCKAERSSFERLRQQIYKLEMEQKRLEEDAFVYNWLQQQLKLSPAYKKMLEIGAHMELKDEAIEPADGLDTESSDISFEELLAQEKTDSFWQKKGRSRTCSSQ